MSYLIVVAHPDDEVLGAGATIKKLAEKGEKINLCIMSTTAEARNYRPSDEELYSDMEEAVKYIGIQKIYRGAFPNIKMNTVPHLELVQFIEKIIEETAATHVITHHPSDLNNDHKQTSIACQAAVRLFQRRTDIVPVKELLYMEVVSSTEWALNSAEEIFRPNVFVEVGEKRIEDKIKALGMYRDVMREYPHPRSTEVIKGLAAYRGAQVGVKYAEAFQCAFMTK